MQHLASSTDHPSPTHTQEFPPYPATPLELVVPSMNALGINLLEQHLVCYPNARISAEEAMRHDYFADVDPALKL